MNIQNLYYFQSLAKHEHYQIAAEEQMTSQSSISYAISSIEKEIGLPLFQKSGRNIKLTHYGFIFLDYANNIISTYEDALNEMNELRTSINSFTKIASLNSLSLEFVPNLLAEFNNSFKEDNVSFEVFHLSTTEIVQEMKKGNIFLAFAMQVSDPEILAYPLFKEEFVLVAPKGKYAIDKPLENLDFLKDENFVSFKPEYSMYKTISKIYESYNFRPSLSYYAPNDPALVKFVAAGLGAAITPYSPLLDEMNVDVFHFKSHVYRTICLLWLKDAPMTAVDKKLKKYVLEHSNIIKHLNLPES
ncbi:LysR substrate-binding domain-containing protein [Peptoniphilus equinus]|uniref:LysR substrate-binding domain-containing protein n=1 Tax=Peptoniphilus equinus TaxID=3016343 RepID=A0ABY7QVU5_9FIRM|nr:LysR substrate-binding domain-containing protein [Peptoniphilus equinus]WBW50038.1 LysR substrate-binding domain-containing protein [Peptoniphilus equinus]